MPGMNSGLNINDAQVVSAFGRALLHQGLIAVLLFATLGVIWVSARAWHSQKVAGEIQVTDKKPPDQEPSEPIARQVLRIGFGLIWIFDGILQAQPKMALGLPSQVIQPTAASSPHWVQTLVNWAGTNWSYHPLQAAAAAVWIQVGIGVWLLASPKGRLSQLAGLASLAWSLVIWVFGESFGGVLAPGQTFLFGAPGAALIYAVATGVIALPDRAWTTRRLGRALLGGTGVFLLGMALLQAWPGRGFWQGTIGGTAGPGQAAPLADMASSMAQLSQPAFLVRLVSSFTSFDEAHGFAVNLIAVIALAVIGCAFLLSFARNPEDFRIGRLPVLKTAQIAFAALCLLDWVFIEDLGFFGGLGTDPNSMIPMVLLAVAGYLALTRPAPAGAGVEVGAQAPARATRHPALNPAKAFRLLASTSFRSIVAAGAVAVIVLGAAPLAIAQANPDADPILAQAISGRSSSLDLRAPGFTLTDQSGHQISLASLRGKVVLLTFLDPVCTTDCPLMGTEFAPASRLLSADSGKVEMVGVVLSPSYRSLSVVRAFDEHDGLTSIPNWHYLTGSLASLKKVWADYGMTADVLPAGAMTGHDDEAFLISQDGKVVREFSADPGPGTSATISSYSVLFANAVRQELR